MPCSGLWGCLLSAAGHSLGGALATLAAYDLRKRLQAGGRPEVEVLCYTFGAPRTGNHAFATDYNHVVPDTWSIINDQACLTKDCMLLRNARCSGATVTALPVNFLAVFPTFRGQPDR